MAVRTSPLPPEGVREASLRVAMEIIAAEGPESLSLREVARRLGVSHQAPYKYFPSREHLIAELVGRSFVAFGEALEAAAATEQEPGPSLIAMGQGYLDFVARHPFEYRMMFSIPLPPAETHPEMAQRAISAFQRLREGVLRLHRQHGRPDPESLADQDALHIWATMHGLATILRHDSIEVIGLKDSVLQNAPMHAFISLAAALLPPGQTPSAAAMEIAGRR